jgi:D-glycero-D-manno-heptose 1,7-bisphosphate phosphatase
LKTRSKNFTETRFIQKLRRKTDLHVLKTLYAEASKTVRGPAVFIDRDGVINCRRPDDYVLDWSQFIFVPGIRDALKQLSSLGLPMIIISNQAAVGKGLLDTAGLEEITNKMHQVLTGDGTFLAAAYYCTHKPDENCVCRKPKPALLFAAATDFNIDLRRSVFIGDSETDMQAARFAGCASVLFDPEIVPQPSSPKNLLTVRNVAELYAVTVQCLQGIEHA